MLILTLSLPLIWAWSSHQTIPIWSTVSRYYFARNSHSSKLSLNRIQIMNYCNPRFTNMIHHIMWLLCKKPSFVKAFTRSNPTCVILSKTFKSLIDLEEKPHLGFLIWNLQSSSTQFIIQQSKLDVINTNFRWHLNKKWLCVVCLCVCIKLRLKMKITLWDSWFHIWFSQNPLLENNACMKYIYVCKCGAKGVQEVYKKWFVFQDF